MDKEDAVCVYNGILSSQKQKDILLTVIMRESAKSNQYVREIKMLHDHTCMQNLKTTTTTTRIKPNS